MFKYVARILSRNKSMDVIIGSKIATPNQLVLTFSTTKNFCKSKITHVDSIWIANDFTILKIDIIKKKLVNTTGKKHC